MLAGITWHFIKFECPTSTYDWYGLLFASIALTGLFECVRQLEDPFVSHTTLDGIDVREELYVLAYQELMVARMMLFPEAAEFVLKRDCFEDDVIVNVPADRGDENEGKENDGCEGNLDRRSRHFSERGSQRPNV